MYDKSLLHLSTSVLGEKRIFYLGKQRLPTSPDSSFWASDVKMPIQRGDDYSISCRYYKVSHLRRVNICTRIDARHTWAYIRLRVFQRPRFFLESCDELLCVPLRVDRQTS